MAEMSESNRWAKELAQFDEVLANPKGQAIVIVGPERSGKSELLRTMVIRGEKSGKFHVEGKIYGVGQNDLPKEILREIGNWSSGQIPRMEARSIVGRLGLSVKEYGDLHRRVIGVDAKPKMAASFLRWWLPIIRELPEKVKFIFTERPDGMLAANKQFMGLPNVVRIDVETGLASDKGGIGESEVRAAFLRFVTTEKGYPEGCVKEDTAIAVGIGKTGLHDLTAFLLGTEKVLWIANIGLWSDIDEQRKPEAVVERIRQASEYKGIRGFIVRPGQNPSENECDVFEVLNEGPVTPISPRQFPSYESYRNMLQRNRKGELSGESVIQDSSDTDEDLRRTQVLIEDVRGFRDALACRFSRDVGRIVRRGIDLAKEVRPHSPRLTTSCLVFAMVGAGREAKQQVTERFLFERVRETEKRVLNLHLEAAMKSQEARGEKWEGGVALTDYIAETVKRAKKIATETTGNETIHVRHLFAGLLVFKRPRGELPEVGAQKRLREMGVSIEKIKGEFLGYLEKADVGDDMAAWGRILKGENVEETDAIADSEAGVAGASIGGSSVSDQPAKIDALGFEPYTRAIANFLSHEDTSPPLTMSVEGEWGSGKSSFMMQLEDRLEAEDGAIVKFSPWRHDAHESLWAAFALEFARQLSEKLPWRKALKARIRLMWERFNWREGWVEVGKAGAVWLVYALVLAGVIVIVWGQGLPYVRNVVLKLFASVAAVLGVIIIALKKVKDFVGSPLRFDLKKYVERPDYAARVCFVERFHRDFKKIIDVYAEKKRVYVFIDDLDRCEVPKAANLMQAINLMISDNPSVVFIMGMDRQKVAAGLAVKDERIIPYVNHELVSDRSGSGEDSHWLSGLKYGYEFIEKFIQLPFSVPRPRGSDIEEMMDSIAGKKRREEKGGRAAVTGGKVAERMSIGDEGSPRDREVAARGGDATGEKQKVEKSREKETQQFELSIADDSPAVRDIVLMAASALDFNPRRIKQFINLFRLRAYIAYETGQLVSRENAGREGAVTLEQLGKIVAILLKWPLLLESVAQDKRLLVRLSLFAEGRSNSNFPHEEGDKRWTGDSQLIQLLRFGWLDKQGKEDAEGKRYSLVDVSIDSILEVSPFVRRMGKTRGEDIE
jgi:hypothetical protein